MSAKVSLEQWRALLAVIDAGGYAKAAEFLGKSQSAVSYSIQQLEQALGISVFALQGRRAVPTPAGQLLYRRARQLLEEAEGLELAACKLGAGIEAQVRLALDLILPPALVLRCLALFAQEFPDTRIELIESVLSGTEDALIQREVDLAILPRVPVGFLGDRLLHMEMVAVAHPNHPLHALAGPITYEDLRRHRQLIVRDSGQHRRHSEGWQGAEQRWTVGHVSTSLLSVRLGLGYAWFPLAYISADLQRGDLRQLNLREGAVRSVQTYLVFSDRDGAGPATLRLAEILQIELPASCQGEPGIAQLRAPGS
jgi:DNA-binding transcriptional LysR family regulator